MRPEKEASKPRKSGLSEFLTTLVFLDEPQVILLKHTKKSYFICVAVDNADDDGEFVCAQVSEIQLDRYLRGKSDLLYLFKYPQFNRWGRFSIFNMKENKIRIKYTEFKDLLDEELPLPGFFSRDHTEEFSINGEPSSNQNFDIDGSWDLPEFTQFYSKLTDLYVYELSLLEFSNDNVNAEKKRKIADAFSTYPWRGGSSYVHFYSDLLKSQSPQDRLGVRSIQYASPGHVDISGRREAFDKIILLVKNFENNRNLILEKYNKLHKYLRDQKLLRVEGDRFDNDSAIADFINSNARSLAADLKLSDIDTVFYLSGKNSLAFAKIVLSICRRMESFFEYFAEGRVEIRK